MSPVSSDELERLPNSETEQLAAISVSLVNKQREGLKRDPNYLHLTGGYWGNGITNTVLGSHCFF